MHLRDCMGWVPIPARGKAPYRFVPFPTFEEFQLLYRAGAKKEWQYKMLKARSDGAEMSEVAKAFGVTKQRVGYLERHFIRKMGAAYISGLLPLEKGRRANENH